MVRRMDELAIRKDDYAYFPAYLYEPKARFDPNDPRVERLAKREHERWLQAKSKAGWRFSERRNDEQRVHPCMCAWEELPEDEKRKDRLLVVEIPEIVASAGMTLARVDAPEELTIGISGHRVLADPERLEAAIEHALRRIEAAHPGRPLEMLSALAEGADRLVLGPALNRPRSRLVAVLPLDKDDYVSDFTASESRDEFVRLLAGADEVVELPAQPERERAYEACGEFICERADVRLAVWDGRNGGRGGTATVVAHARERCLPIAWVHTSDGSVSYENF